MMFANVDSQQTCCEYAMNMFRGRAVLPQNEPKIVGFQDKHKGIPCRRMLVQPSCGGRSIFSQTLEHHVLDTFQMNYASHSHAVSLTMKVVVKQRPWRRQIYRCGGYDEGKSIAHDEESSMVVDTENLN